MNNADVSTKVLWSLHALYSSRTDPQFFRLFINEWQTYQKLHIENREWHFADEYSLLKKINLKMVGAMLFDEKRRTCLGHSLGVISQGSASDRLKFHELSRQINDHVASRRDIHRAMSETCREVINHHYFAYPELIDLRTPTPRQLEWHGLFEGAPQLYTASLGKMNKELS